MADASSLPADLTILTVCIGKHYQYIAQQIALADALNPGVAWRMIVVDNAAQNGAPALKSDDPRCEILVGPAPDLTLPRNCVGSYHHASALNFAMKHVKTRYLLVLDPDLFPVYHGWMRQCIAHMTKRDLGIFGVPWHYRWYNKYRYYPCVHFALIDLQRIAASSLDFEPDILSRKSPTLTWWQQRQQKFFLTKSRHRIESSGDTGWRLHHDFSRSTKSDVVLPVLDVATELAKPGHLKKTWGRAIERLLPPRWSFLPKRGSYVAPSQAPAIFHPTLRALAPETFVWRGAPFAFHLRRQVRDEVPGYENTANEAELLPPLLDSIAASRAWHQWAFAPARTAAAPQHAEKHAA